MPTKRVRFPGAFGDSLAARLELPAEGDPRAYALFAHCFTCSKDLKAIRRISRTLAERGIAVLRFDFTASARASANSPAPTSARTSTTSRPRPRSCGRATRRRRC